MSIRQHKSTNGQATSTFTFFLNKKDYDSNRIENLFTTPPPQKKNKNKKTDILHYTLKDDKLIMHRKSKHIQTHPAAEVPNLYIES